jgi:hypothetical protein
VPLSDKELKNNAMKFHIQIKNQIQNNQYTGGHSFAKHLIQVK